MRKIFLFMNVSLDGYFEGPGHDLSWTPHDFEAFPTDEDNQADAFLFGHTTYDMMKSFWPTPQAQQMLPAVAKVMNETPKFVVTHTPFEPGWQHVTVISHDVIPAIKRLKEQSGKSIGIFGSNTLCVSLIPEGLIDEFQIVVNPVAIGAGTTLFKGLTEPAKLALTETRPFKSGAVQLTYKPT